MIHDRIIYIFIGPPGSGKGTLAAECVKQFGWVKLSTGDLCRQHISQKTEIGKQIDLIIKSGKLIPDELVSSMVDEWLAKQIGLNKSIILDGYPRTEQQVYQLFNMLREKYTGIKYKIVKFDISDDAVINRLSSRLVCQNKECQAVYSTLEGAGLAPKVPMQCDLCGQGLIQRADDSAAVIRDRLVVYHQHDLTNLFKQIGQQLELIDSDRSFDEIFNDFRQLVKRDRA